MSEKKKKQAAIQSTIKVESSKFYLKYNFLLKKLLITIEGGVPYAGGLLEVSGEQVQHPKDDVRVDFLVREAVDHQPGCLAHCLLAECV